MNLLEPKIGDTEYYKCATPGCGEWISLNERDRARFVQNGWTYPDGSLIKPKWCHSCRAKRNAERNKRIGNV